MTSLYCFSNICSFYHIEAWENWWKSAKRSQICDLVWAFLSHFHKFLVYKAEILNFIIRASETGLFFLLKIFWNFHSFYNVQWRSFRFLKLVHCILTYMIKFLDFKKHKCDYRYYRKYYIKQKDMVIEPTVKSFKNDTVMFQCGMWILFV